MHFASLYIVAFYGCYRTLQAADHVFSSARLMFRSCCRLCVPCFVNWGLKGTTDNGKRYCISQVLELGIKDITIMRYDGTTPACAGVVCKKRKTTPELTSPTPQKKKAPADRKPDLSSEDPYQRTYSDKAGTSSRSSGGMPRNSPMSSERKDRGKERKDKGPSSDGYEVSTLARLFFSPLACFV